MSNEIAMVSLKWLRKSTHLHKTDESIMCQRALEAFHLIPSNLNRIKPKPFVTRLVFFGYFRSSTFVRIYRIHLILTIHFIYYNNKHTSLTSFRLFLICSHFAVLFHNEIFHPKGYYGSAIFCIDNQVIREILWEIELRCQNYDWKDVYTKKVSHGIDTHTHTTDMEQVLWMKWNGFDS